MTELKDRYLTIRWNNILTLVLGLIVFGYIGVVLANGTWEAREGLVGLAILGAVY